MASLTVESAAMLIILATLYHRAHRNKDDNTVFGREKNKEAFGRLLPLAAYPFVFCIFAILPLVSRLYSSSANSSEVSPLVTVLIAVCIPFWSFSTAATLIIHIVMAELYFKKRTSTPLGRGSKYNTIKMNPGDLANSKASKGQPNVYINSNTSFLLVADSLAD